MSSFGVISTGFSKKSLSDVLAELDADLKATIDPNLNTTTTSIIGQMLGVFAAAVAEEWDVLEAVYSSNYPDTADGASFDAVAAITGALRLAATRSTVTLFATGDDATLLPAGRQARVPAGGTFETLAPATTALTTPWAPTTAYAIGDIVSNDTPLNVYVAVAAGTSAGAGGPTGEGVAIVDGGVTWRFLGDGEAHITVAAQATLTGPTVGQAFTISSIVTPVAGWLSVTNQTDAAIGTDIETDAAFRLRREQLIRVTGKATLEAVRSAVLNVADVSEVIVFENTTLITDPSGIPGKAFEVVVLGGTDLAIAQTIFDTKPIGIQAFGDDISELIVDSLGNSHLIEASRPLPVEMFLDITVITDGTYPIDGDAQVAQILKDLGDDLIIGDDVIYAQFFGEALTTAGGISGVVDISSMVLDKRPVVVTSGNTETFALVDGQTLTVKVDGESAAQTATFNTGDFGDIANALASEVAAVITADIAGATGGDAAGAVTITSDDGGTIEVTGGTANAALGFPTTFAPAGLVNVPITNRQLATFDTSRIGVTSI